MRFTTHILALFCLLISTPSYGQFWKKLTLEAGYNKSKVINTRKISSFEAQRIGRTYVLHVEHEISPITDNNNISIGYAISKKHHIRIRYAKNTLGSRLEGTIQITYPANPSAAEFTSTFPLERNYTERPSTSLGILYEYHTPLHDGNVVLGAGMERQRNEVIWETLVLPGIRSRSYSFHSHIGYLSEPITFVQVHAKIFSTYYFPSDIQIYDIPITSKYVPIQIGIEIGFRINLKDIFIQPVKKKKRRRKKKRR